MGKGTYVEQLANMRHRVVLCSQADVVVGTDIKLVKEDVISLWASIIEKRGSSFTPNGAVTDESRNSRSHVIWVRYQPVLNISQMAWLYEERLKSSPRWFKILSVSQTEIKGTQFYNLDCRISERGDNLATPTEAADSCGPVQGMPAGVKL